MSTDLRAARAANPSTDPCGAPSAGARAHAREEGRVGLFMAALVGVLAAMVAVGAAITQIHVQDRRLLACADAVATTASATIAATDYYLGDTGTFPPPDRDLAADRAAAALVHLKDTTCRIGDEPGPALTAVDVGANGAVHVEIVARARLPTVPPAVARVALPELVARSSARTTASL